MRNGKDNLAPRKGEADMDMAKALRRLVAATEARIRAERNGPEALAEAEVKEAAAQEDMDQASNRAVRHG